MGGGLDDAAIGLNLPGVIFFREHDVNTAPQGLLCPTCKVDLVMSERQGIEIDYCPKCRGVWLDRGELDKIIAKSAEEEVRGRGPQQEQRGYPQDRGYQQQDRGYQGRRDRDDDDDDNRFGGFGGGGFLGRLFD
jgi:Zn-finger nucleic acid-binding protein